jgi:Ca-activated chloride channel family protein
MRTLWQPTFLIALLTHALAPGQGVFVPGETIDRVGPGIIAHDPQHPWPRPRPWPAIPVESGLLQVRATITDGVASTELQQTLRNLTGQQQEAYWVLPLPPGASADRFTMTVNGQETAGEVLDAARARSIYEEIVRKRRDPGLLEYLGYGMLRARVFPIPPNAELQVKVRFAELLPPSGGLTTWRWPLRAAYQDGRGPQKVSLLAEIRSSTPIKNLFSPLPGVEITRQGECQARVGFELAQGQVPQRDLELHYGLSEQDFGAHVLTYRVGAEGYYLLMLAPKREWPDNPRLVRSIQFVVDTSGSMAGEKIAQAKGAVRQFLASLKPTDWFDVIPFSTEARPFFGAPQLATADKVEEALAKVDALEARGGTNIGEALGLALKNPDPDCYKTTSGMPVIVPITVFLTDGLPTVGTTDVDALLAAAKDQNAAKTRVFVFGVGHDVNTRLLDTLAQAHRGDRDYVQPGENIEVKTGALFQKLSGPVMTDVQVAIDGLQTSATEPAATPDLFVNSTLVLVGRYRGEGHKAIRLKGRLGDRAIEYVFEATFPADAKTHDWLPGLWGQRRIATLLEAIRRNGQHRELVDEVTRIGKECGIVTPYTSHLILEEGQTVAMQRGVAGGRAGGFAFGDGREMDRVRGEWLRAGVPQAAAPAAPADLPGLAARQQAEAAKARESLDKPAPETGAAAVEQSVALRTLLVKDSYTRDDGSAVQLTQQRLGARQFFLVDGVWVDQAFRKDQQVTKVAAFSDEYFALLAARPHLARVFAFSTRMVVVDGDSVFEVM